MPCLPDGLHADDDLGVDNSVESVKLDDMNVLTEKPSTTFGDDDRRFVYSVARRIVATDEDADDVAQEALLLAHRHIASFRGDSRLRTWLYRIAVTTALGHLRRTKRSQLHVPVTDVALPDPSKSPEAVVADAESDALVREAVQELEPLYRDVLIARAYASEAEVAECLGISIANVKIRAHRARHQLRTVLQDKMAA
jgi:RNA polymerase sigma-70 factor, ECF subfamily